MNGPAVFKRSLTRRHSTRRSSMCEVHDSQLKMVVKIDDLLTSLYITVTLPACLLRVTTVTIFVD